MQKISVACCTYNGEKFIIEQLKSIVNQEMPVDEIIICDDKSTDSTAQLIKEFKLHQHNTPTILLYENPTRLGVVKNFEKSISLCTGDIIFCSDQDDFWESTKTRTIINYLNQHETKELVFTNASLIDAKGAVFTQLTLFDVIGLNGSIYKAWNNGLELEITNAFANKVTGATIAFRSSIIPRAIPFRDSKNNLHDNQLSIAAINYNTIGVINKKLTRYRIHSNNTAGLNSNFKQKSIISIKKVYAYYSLSPKFSYSPSNPFIKKKQNFIIYRQKHIQTLKGRLKLICSITNYYRIYKRYFIFFYLTDIFIGLPAHLKRIITGIRFRL